MTFLEVVLAATLLALLAGTVFGGFSAMIGAQERQVRRLACMELANRLILQYLDDPTAMPTEAQPIRYAGVEYRWSMQRQPVQFDHGRPEAAAERAAASSLRLERFVNMHVTVWVGAASGGADHFDPLIPHAAVSRLVDPIGTRNPDSLENIFRNPGSAAYRNWWDELNRASSTVRTSPRGGGSTPPPRGTGGGR
jgi:type II secretory pathway pseudopilin PulG